MSYLNIRGKQLYVETFGSDQCPTLLYLHGGPGASSHDFNLFQGERLSQQLRVVSIDQRGVLRSERISDHEQFGFQDLIDDCEALKEQLGLKRWSVLGHSFGGMLGTHYALQHPESIQCLILECPSFDIEMSFCSYLQAMALEFMAIGDKEHALECWRVSMGSQDKSETVRAFWMMKDALGDRWEPMHIQGKEKNVFDRIFSEARFTDDEYGRTGTHEIRLYEEGKLFESLLPRLVELRVPTLLLKGKYDLAMTNVQVETFVRDVAMGQTEIFQNSGHFPRIDEPEQYQEVVTSFVLQNSSALHSD